jgi:hypothetical protein
MHTSFVESLVDEAHHGDPMRVLARLPQRLDNFLASGGDLDRLILAFRDRVTEPGLPDEMFHVMAKRLLGQPA